MAERRMFAKTIIDSDAFLDMPLSAQALYFHLSMRADDEGFINNPRKIQRMIGAADDDLKLLIAKNFIIPFDSGVVVIKHWRIHNYIRADRLLKTAYTEERERLEIKDNGSYTLASRPAAAFCQSLDGHLTDKCQSNDGQMTDKCPPNVSIGKDRIGEDSIGKDRIGQEREMADKAASPEAVAMLFNEICVSFPKVTKLSDMRRRAINARLKVYTLEEMKTIFEKVEASSFLKGGNDRNWTASFDWIIKDSNAAKIMDGNYDDKRPKPKDADRLEQDYAMISQWAGGDQ